MTASSAALTTANRQNPQARNLPRLLGLGRERRGEEAERCTEYERSPIHYSTCIFLASDASAYVTGDTTRVMGGRVIG